MINILKITYYTCIVILFIVELPLIILLGVFGGLFGIFEWLYNAVTTLNLKLDNSPLSKIYNVEVLFPDGWKQVNTEKLTLTEAKGISEHWNKEGYKTTLTPKR